MTAPLQRLPLTALRTFEAAARLLSFKGAADELCVSATTVSNQIRHLEKVWQTKLFVRHTRSVSLTAQGRALSQVTTRAFGEIQAEIQTNILNAKTTITLAVGPMFGSHWLIPRLAQFHTAHPEIDLVITHGSRLVDSAMMSSDIAVDWGSGHWPGLKARRLMDITYGPVASEATSAPHLLAHSSSRKLCFPGPGILWLVLPSVALGARDGWLSVAHSGGYINPVPPINDSPCQ